MLLDVHHCRRDDEEYSADPRRDAEENLLSSSSLDVRRACTSERSGES